MVRHASLFSQILGIIPRMDFQRVVRDAGTDRYTKRFTSWDHLVSLLFCQFAQAKSLREISQGLTACLGKLNHLGVRHSPNKSTLAYANKHRDWTLFEVLFYKLARQLTAQLAGRTHHRLKLPGKLYSMDASIIPLCLSLFDWSRYQTAKGAVKLHMVLDHDGFLPCFARITLGKRHDVPIGRQFWFPPGSVVVVDRGYFSVDLFAQWIRGHVFFVTRLVANSRLTVVEDRPCEGPVLRDQFVEFAAPQTRKRYPYIMRRIEYYDEKSDRVFVYLTNQLEASALTIAEVYRQRWQIELFFKAIKQNLRIKTFIGTSPNAVSCQIWTALITMLLMRFLQLRSRRGWALSNLVALLRLNLFTYRDLWRWLDDPFEVPPGGPPGGPPYEQLALRF